MSSMKCHRESGRRRCPRAAKNDWCRVPTTGARSITSIVSRLGRGVVQRGMSAAIAVLLVMWALLVHLTAAAPQQSAGAAGSAPAPAAATTGSAERVLLNRYCVSCHNSRLKTAGLALDALDVDDVAAAPQVWEQVVRKVRAGVRSRARPGPRTSTRS